MTESESVSYKVTSDSRSSTYREVGVTERVCDAVEVVVRPLPRAIREVLERRHRAVQLVVDLHHPDDVITRASSTVSHMISDVINSESHD